MSKNSFPFVIVSGYGTPRQQIYTGAEPAWVTPSVYACPWRARSLSIAKFVALDQHVSARRKHISIVKNFGTRYERVVWERIK